MSSQPDSPPSQAKPAGHHQSFWLWVMCLTGVDYFSTLGYQPSIAFESAGTLAPLATVVLVLVTLFGALPIYAYVARKSHTGQGSIGMLAKLVSGWPGKILVLVLLGFAATDFVITKTLSAADAAEHAIQNPAWPLRPVIRVLVAKLPLSVGTTVTADKVEVRELQPHEMEDYQKSAADLLPPDLDAVIGRTPKVDIAPGGMIKITDFFIGAQEAKEASAEFKHAEALTAERQHREDRQRLLVTFLLLVLLGASFMRGFGEVISIAVVIVAVFLIINLLVVIGGISHLCDHPHLLRDWWAKVRSAENNWYLSEPPPISGTGLWTIFGLSLLIFPKLALGLSGFETGVAVMPLIRGNPNDDPKEPTGRIRNTRKLLITAAVIMSGFLIFSSVVVCTLIPPDAFKRVETDSPTKKYAKDRALAYLAHGDGPEKIPMAGEALGTIYDISTIVILWFAGASAMAGLLNLVPQYLPRYGMAPNGRGR